MIEADHSTLEMSNACLDEHSGLVIPLILPGPAPAYQWEAEDGSGEYMHCINIYKCRRARLIIGRVKNCHKLHQDGRLGNIEYRDGAVVVEGADGCCLARAEVSRLSVVLEIDCHVVDVLTVYQYGSGVQILDYGFDYLRKVTSEVGIEMPDIDSQNGKTWN